MLPYKVGDLGFKVLSADRVALVWIYLRTIMGTDLKYDGVKDNSPAPHFLPLRGGGGSTSSSKH